LYAGLEVAKGSAVSLETFQPPRRRLQQREKIVQQQIVHLLRSIGAAVYVLGTKRPREDSQGTRQTPGIPDLYTFLPPPRLQTDAAGDHYQHGCGLWIEVKAQGGRLRPEQVQFREGCGFAHVPHVTGGVDQVIAFLMAGGWLKADNLPHYRLPERTGT
jgi:hypothetical protein